jgi:hypothetical protein
MNLADSNERQVTQNVKKTAAEHPEAWGISRAGCGNSLLETPRTGTARTSRNGSHTFTRKWTPQHRWR